MKLWHQIDLSRYPKMRMENRTLLLLPAVESLVTSFSNNWKKLEESLQREGENVRGTVDTGQVTCINETNI